jgi:hypothetical protein
VVRAQRVPIGFLISTHLRFRVFTGNVSRGASPPSGYSVVIPPFRHLHPTRETRRFQCGYGAVPVQFQCNSGPFPAAIADPRQPANTRRAARPAEPPTAPEEPRPSLRGLRRAYGAPGAVCRRAGRLSTALDRRPYAGRQDGGHRRQGTVRDVPRSSPRVPETRCPKLRCLCLLRSPI